MSAVQLERVSADLIRERFRSLMRHVPKMKYSIVEIMGDMYYKELSEDEAIELTFKKMEAQEEV